MRNDSLVNQWLNDWKQQQMMATLAAEKEEQEKRKGLFNIFNIMMEEKAREEQMAQQAAQFAQQLKLDQQKFEAQERYNNARLKLQQQAQAAKMASKPNINPALYSPEYEKTTAREEAKRVDIMRDSAYKLNLRKELAEIYNAEKALKEVKTGPEWKRKAGTWLIENLNPDQAATNAYANLKVFSGDKWIEKMEKIVGNLSNDESSKVEGFVFGLDLPNKKNMELLKALEDGLLNLDSFREFANEYEQYNGTTRGVDKAWGNYINSPQAKEELKKKRDAIRQEMGFEFRSEGKNLAPVKQDNNTPNEPQNSQQSAFGENMRQFGDALWQFPIDLYYNTVEGKEAPQLVPESERNLGYTIGDLTGYIGGITGLAKTSAKAFAKAGVKNRHVNNPFIHTMLGSAGIGGAKDYNDRIGGAIKEGLLGGLGYGTAKGVEKFIVEPLAKLGRGVLTKGAKKTELAGLMEEEGKAAGDVYDKILGKYKFGDNPAMDLVKGIQKEYKAAREVSGKEYKDLFKAADEAGVFISPEELPKSVQNIFKRYKADKLEKLSAKDVHEVLKNLKQQKRANTRTLERGDNVNVFKLEEEEALLNKAIDDLQAFMTKKVPGYEQVSTQFKENVVPFTSTRTGKSIAKEEKDIPNFAKKLNEGQEEGMRELYNILPNKLKKTAAAGEFIKGQNITGKDTKEASQLYQDLMKRGTKNARTTIEGQIGKETGDQLNRLSKEIRDVTGELQRLNAINPNEDITKLVNYLSNGQVQKVAGLIEKLLESPVGEGIIKALEKLQKALNYEKGRVLTSTLLSASKPYHETEE